MLGLEEDDVALGPTREGRKEEKKNQRNAGRCRARARAGLACSFEQLRWCPALLFFLLLFFSVSFSNIDLELI
jgi:hypothetical protein